MPKPTLRPKDSQNFWNFVLSVAFSCVLIVAMYEIWGKHGDFPHSIPLFDALLLALASFRLTRLFVYDKIMRWFRELFVSKREVVKDGATWVEMLPADGILRTGHDLLGCPWCIGFWSALVVTFLYFTFSWAWLVILFLAVAGAGSVMQITANAIGWTAENLKLDAHRKEETNR